MNDFLQTLKDAFPLLKNHPVFVARIALVVLVLSALYVAKGLRKRVCLPLHARLSKKILATTRWLRVYQADIDIASWKYYTFEIDGWDEDGDDMIWTLVQWPSLRPKESLRMHGAVGNVNALRDSQDKLYKRWGIVHEPNIFIGPVPAWGLRSLLRRAAAKVLWELASI
jgi:hypothetical protein